MMDLCGTQVIGGSSGSQRNDSEENNQIGVLRIGQQEHKILKGVNRIGRSPVCTIVLNDATASKVHAEIQADVEVSFLADLRSSNGTKIKNASLKPFFYYQVADGDVIHFGTVEALYKTIERPQRRAIVPGNTSSSKVLSSPQRSTTLENLPGNSFNESSICESDCSALRGVQNEPRMMKKTAISQKVSENNPFVPMVERKRINTANTTDIQDMETQPIEDTILRDYREPKRPRLEEQVVETNLYEAETQIIPVTEAPRLSDRSNDSDSRPVISPTPSEESLNLLTASKYRENFEKETKPNLMETSAASREDILRGNKNNEEQKSRIDSRLLKDCNVVADSDDSLTDEDIELEIVTKKSKEGNHNVIKHSDKSIKVSNNSNKVREPVDETSNTEDDIPTQQIVVNSKNQTIPAEVAHVSVNSRNSRFFDESELPPTQIIEPPPTSTPLNCYKKVPQVWPVFGKSIQKGFRGERDAIMEEDPDDLQCAPTQIILDEDHPQDAETAKRNDSKNGNQSNEDLNKSDDKVAKKLQELLGRETIDAESTDDSTQLMTQNLIDILKPSQNSKDSSVSVTEKNSPQRRQNHRGPGTLGFIGGRAVDSRTEFVTTASPPKKNNSRDKATKIVSTSSTPKGSKDDDRDIRSASAARTPQKTGSCDKEIIKPRKVTKKTGRVLSSSSSSSGGAAVPRASTPATPTAIDNVAGDDILFGLPKVSICGTLSNPGSPAVSSSSSRNDPRLSRSREVSSDRESLRMIPRDCVVGLSRIDQMKKTSESVERDSPVRFKTGRKTAATRSIVNRIIDEDDDNNDKILNVNIDDSDDELDYNHLKKIADKLLKSQSNASVISTPKRKTRSKGRTTGAADDSESSLYHVGKTLNTKRVALSKKRDDKLSRAPVSLPVSGRTAASTTNHSEISSAKGGIESQEVEGIFAASRKQEEDLVSNSAVRLAGNRRTLSRVKPATSKSTARLALSTDQNNIRISDAARDHAILFTGIKEESYIKIITKLGGSVVSEPIKATVLVTDKIRRTFKFLCAVARGLPVVSDTWLQESNKASQFLDCADFILKDPASEATFKFSLSKSLQQARKKKILQGYTLIVTPKVNQPDINQLKGMVEASGGRVLVRAPRSWDTKTLIISREEDITAARALLAKSPKSLKTTVHSIEFVLSGILQQEVNLEDYKLNLS